MSLQELIEYVKQLEKRIKELEKQIKPVNQGRIGA